MDDSFASPPWTEEQLDALWRWQTCGWVHEFTCPNHGDSDHKRFFAAVDCIDALTPTADGWVCPACAYTQNWAHRFMLTAPPPNPLTFLGAGDAKLSSTANPDADSDMNP